MDIQVVEIQLHHLEALYAWEIDERLQVQTGIEKARTYVQFQDSYHSYLRGDKPRLYINVIEAEGQPVGKIELYQSTGKAYLGVVMGKREGEGIGTKALALFLDKIKTEMDLQAIQAEIYEDNQESIRFFRKNGFYPTGEVESEIFRGEKRQLILLERTL